MNAIEQATALAQALDAREARIGQDRLYLEGRQPLAFTNISTRDATRMSRMASNIPSVQVNAIAERLRVIDLLVDGEPDQELWEAYRRNDCDQTLPAVFREALGVGVSYVTVWDPTGSGRPLITPESADQVIVHRDPMTREPVAAFKRVTDGDESVAWLYLPDRIVQLRANGQGAALGWKEGESLPNPLGRPPVVEFSNDASILGGGVSEVEDLKPLVDALNKVLADMMVGSEFYARPRRWATGVEMDSDEDGKPINPFPEGDRMMISEAIEAKFGSLPAADLNAYEAGVKILLGQIMANSALPSHYLGQLTGQAPGADGLRAAEAALSARAEAKQALFGRSVEQVGRLAQAIITGKDPEALDVRVRWADPATRSMAQEADAVVKLHGEGLLPTDFALARLGYDKGEIKQIRQARLSAAAEQVRLTQ